MNNTWVPVSKHLLEPIPDRLQYKSSIKGSLKVGFQLLFLSNYLLKGVSSSKRNVKGTYQQLFNFLSRLLKAKKGVKGC